MWNNTIRYKSLKKQKNIENKEVKTMLINTSVKYQEGDIRYFGHKHHVRFLTKDKTKFPNIRDPYPKAVNHNHPKYVYQVLEDFTTFNGTQFKKDEIVLLPSTLCFGRKNN